MGRAWRAAVGQLAGVPQVLLVALSLFAHTVRVCADLPVHCVRHEVVGEWRFTLGPLREHRSSCGHLRPDSENAQPSRSVVDIENGTTQLMVMLRNPNLAATARDPSGTWTMIYDEGFEVRVGDLEFFAFSNFTLSGNGSLHGHKKNTSHCFQTMVGWYQNKERTRFGCYYGGKVLQQPARSAPSARTAAGAHSSRAALAARSSTAYDRPLDDQTQRQVVSKLNHRIAMLQLGWKARHMPQWRGWTMRQVNAYAGMQRPTRARELHRQMLQQHQRPPQAAGGAQSFVQEGASSRERGPLPKQWDWSSVGGRSYLEPVMDQGDCGSCYAASSMRMLTARHKIKQNDTQLLPWSIGLPLFCSEYNQGCNGGYGVLTARWSRDVGLLPATCLRYRTGGSCKLECDLAAMNDTRYRADNHRYVGAWYGNTSAEAVKEELYRNGPLVLGLEPSEDFMFYSEGIYRSSAHSTLFHSPTQEWQQVDHAVLLVGYGEEGGQPYWKIQNSWGADWGEHGFFRIAMGRNEAGIESIAEAADVVVDEQNGAQMTAFFEQLGRSSQRRATA